MSDGAEIKIGRGFSGVINPEPPKNSVTVGPSGALAITTSLPPANFSKPDHLTHTWEPTYKEYARQVLDGLIQKHARISADPSKLLDGTPRKDPLYLALVNLRKALPTLRDSTRGQKILGLIKKRHQGFLTTLTRHTEKGLVKAIKIIAESNPFALYYQIRREILIQQSLWKRLTTDQIRKPFFGDFTTRFISDPVIVEEAPETEQIVLPSSDSDSGFSAVFAKDSPIRSFLVNIRESGFPLYIALLAFQPGTKEYQELLSICEDFHREHQERETIDFDKWITRFREWYLRPDIRNGVTGFLQSPFDLERIKKYVLEVDYSGQTFAERLTGEKEPWKKPKMASIAQMNLTELENWIAKRHLKRRTDYTIGYDRGLDEAYERQIHLLKAGSGQKEKIRDAYLAWTGLLEESLRYIGDATPREPFQRRYFEVAYPQASQFLRASGFQNEARELSMKACNFSSFFEEPDTKAPLFIPPLDSEIWSLDREIVKLMLNLPFDVKTEVKREDWASVSRVMEPLSQFVEKVVKEGYVKVPSEEIPQNLRLGGDHPYAKRLLELYRESLKELKSKREETVEIVGPIIDRYRQYRFANPDAPPKWLLLRAFYDLYPITQGAEAQRIMQKRFALLFEIANILRLMRDSLAQEDLSAFGDLPLKDFPELRQGKIDYVERPPTR